MQKVAHRYKSSSWSRANLKMLIITKEKGQTWKGSEVAYLICGKFKPLPQSLLQCPMSAKTGEKRLKTRCQRVYNSWQTIVRNGRRGHWVGCSGGRWKVELRAWHASPLVPGEKVEDKWDSVIKAREVAVPTGAWFGGLRCRAAREMRAKARKNRRRK